MSQPQPGFLISPELLGKVRRTVSRVEGEPVVGKTWTIPTRFEGEESRPQRVFRIAEFTGSWDIDTTKTVTLKYQTTTPNTVVATNLFVDGPPDGPVAIAKEGTAWYAVEFKRDAGSGFRIATFTGAWGIDSLKTVSLKYQSGTLSVLNLFWPLPDAGERDCCIAQEGTAWFLVTPRLFSAHAATAATLTSTQLEFKTLPFPALSQTATSQFTIAIDQCSTAT